MIGSLKITSEIFRNNGMLPTRFTCDGENVNPALIVSGLPMQSKTLAVIVEDMDAPKGPFVHWVVWNIPPTNKIRENTIPGDEGKNDFRKHHYSGPCPTEGTRHYVFKVYALDNFLHLETSATKAELQALMDKHVIASGELNCYYKRKEK